MNVEIFKPSFIKRAKHNMSKKQRLLFLALGKGIKSIYYALIKDEIVHYSIVCKKCWKYSFLKEGEIIIGPCFTDANFRGKGIYPIVLMQIANENVNNITYIAVNKDNSSSIRGIEKAGFSMYGYLEVVNIWKEYRIVNYQTDILLYRK